MNIRTTLEKILLVFLVLLGSSSSHAQIFWEEDFNDTIALLPQGWDNFDNDAGGGLWEITNFGPSGAYAVPDPYWQLQGTNNHWAMFDSDSDCSGDQDSWLVTSAINCLDKDEIWLGFDQFYLNFYCETYIRITTDNTIPLDDWEEIQINITSLNEEGPPVILLDISQYAAQEPSIYIGFEFRNVAGQAPDPSVDGCAYNWQLDNVQVYEANPTTPHNLSTYNNFFAIAPNAQWPLSQIEPFGFLADVVNNGQTNQTGVEIDLEITNTVSNDIVHEETLNLTDLGFDIIPENETVENQLFPGNGFIPTEEVKYVGQYLISADSTDTFPQDNVANFEFEITSSIFAKEDNPTSSIVPQTNTWPDEAPFSWSFGNHYYTPNGDGWYAHEVSFALGNPDDVAGKILNVRLYEWTNIVLGEPTAIAPEDRTLVGFNEYTITGTEGDGEFITIDIFDNISSEKGVELKDGGHYVLMLSYPASDRSTPVEIAGSQLKDYSAQIYRGEQLNKPRYAGILMIGEIADGTFSTVGFGRNVVPCVRMRITDDADDLIAVKDVLSPENKIAIYPNPATDKININLDLAVLEQQVILSVVDVNGKAIQTKTLQQIKAKETRLNIEGLPTGNYFLHVETTAGQRSLPFVVQTSK